MSAKKKGKSGPTPAGNRQRRGPKTEETKPNNQQCDEQSDAGFQEEDPQRRQGDFTDTATHSMQEPGGKKDANH